jgi:hypothetical protein
MVEEVGLSAVEKRKAAVARSGSSGAEAGTGRCRICRYVGLARDRTKLEKGSEVEVVAYLITVAKNGWGKLRSW